MFLESLKDVIFPQWFLIFFSTHNMEICRRCFSLWVISLISKVFLFPSDPPPSLPVSLFLLLALFLLQVLLFLGMGSEKSRTQLSDWTTREKRRSHSRTASVYDPAGPSDQVSRPWNYSPSQTHSSGKHRLSTCHVPPAVRSAQMRQGRHSPGSASQSSPSTAVGLEGQSACTDLGKPWQQ